MRKIALLSLMILLLAACVQPTNEGADVIAELAAQIPDDQASIRGERNCELFEMGIEGEPVVLSVWNNAGQGHDCPDAWLATIDRNQYGFARHLLSDHGDRTRAVVCAIAADRTNQQVLKPTASGATQDQ